MNKLKKYDNGLTLIVSEGGSSSVSFSIMVKAGTINEDEKNNGISHYIEHMNFKGTKEYNSFELSKVLDSFGTSYNAYTSYNATCYYAQCLTEYAEKSFEIMSKAVFSSVYNDEDAEKEKQVIIEEINMSEDSPDDVCFDLVCEALYGNEGYGRTILGSIENVSSFTKQDVLDYISKFYVAKNTCVSFVGDITLEQADKYVQKHLLNIIPTGEVAKMPSYNLNNTPKHLYKNKEIEQAHLCLAFPSVAYGHKDSVASEICANVLGGGMSSRLFQKIREELGLAYSVYSFTYRYEDSAFSGVYAGLNGSRLDEAYNAIKNLLLDFNNGITSEEFEKVKVQLKAGCVFSEDKAMIKSRLFAKHYLMTGEIYDFKKRLEQIERVTLDDVNRCAKLYDLTKMASAVVGKNLKAIEK